LDLLLDLLLWLKLDYRDAFILSIDTLPIKLVDREGLESDWEELSSLDDGGYKRLGDFYRELVLS
jgi:hypothetical protein